MSVYLHLVWSYLKIGLFGFGGGYAMLALIEREIVGNGWITQQMFTDVVAISQMTPGPIGINSATYIGYVVPAESGITGWEWGVLGSLICTLVVVLPSFLLVAYTSHFISRHRESNLIKGIFFGLRPVVIGLIASAALLLMNSENFGSETTDIVRSVSICAGAFILVYFFKVHPIIVILLSALSGWLLWGVL